MSRNPLDSKTNDTERINNSGARRTDSTETMKEKIGEVASKAKDKAGQWTQVASETIDQQRENVSSGLDRAASTLHEKAASIPGGTGAVNTMHRFANGMEATASYLRQHEFADMGDDLLNVCRRYPVQALVSVLAVGFLLGRSSRR